MGRDTDSLDASLISHQGHVCVCPQATTQTMMMILVIAMFCDFVKKHLVYSYFLEETLSFVHYKLALLWSYFSHYVISL